MIAGWVVLKVAQVERVEPVLVEVSRIRFRLLGLAGRVEHWSVAVPPETILVVVMVTF